MDIVSIGFGVNYAVFDTQNAIGRSVFAGPLFNPFAIDSQSAWICHEIALKETTTEARVLADAKVDLGMVLLGVRFVAAIYLLRAFADARSIRTADKARRSIEPKVELANELLRAYRIHINASKESKIQDSLCQRENEAPTSGGASRGASVEVHAWRRHFARILDVYVFAMFTSIVGRMMFPSMFAAIGNDQTLGLVLVAVYIPLLVTVYIPFEGFCLYAFGTTLGKTLYRIELTHDVGGADLVQTTKRSAYVCFLGFGMGIPIITIFTCWHAYNKLNNNGVTTWDSDLGWSVSHQTIGLGRWMVIACAWVAIFVLT